MTHIAETLLLLLVAVHAAIHVKPMLKHAHHMIHRKLGLKVGEKCSRKAALIVVGTMALVACVACAPVVHYTIDALQAAASARSDWVKPNKLQRHFFLPAHAEPPRKSAPPDAPPSNSPKAKVSTKSLKRLERVKGLQ